MYGARIRKWSKYVPPPLDDELLALDSTEKGLSSTAASGEGENLAGGTRTASPEGLPLAEVGRKSPRPSSSPPLQSPQPSAYSTPPPTLSSTFGLSQHARRQSSRSSSSSIVEEEAEDETDGADAGAGEGRLLGRRGPPIRRPSVVQETAERLPLPPTPT